APRGRRGTRRQPSRGRGATRSPARRGPCRRIRRRGGRHAVEWRRGAVQGPAAATGRARGRGRGPAGQEELRPSEEGPEMKAVTYRGVGQVALEEVPEPAIQQPDDAIVKVTRCAICGSDLHIYHGHIPGMVPGFVCGHEFTGVVVEAGPAVRAFRAGDRVVG